MMPFLILIAACVAFLLYLWILDREKGKSYKAGYEAGKLEGHKEGKHEEASWWFNAESEVDQERVKLWRKSGAA